VRFAAEDDARQPAAAVRGHADEVASFLLGGGDDLFVDIVALDESGIQRDAGRACELFDCGEELLRLSLVLPGVSFGTATFGVVGSAFTSR